MSRLRERAARTWLALLFWNTRHATWFVRAIKPVLLHFAWRHSRQIRESTLANARWLLGSDSTPAQRSELGRAVLESFFEAVCDFGRNRGLSAEQMARMIEPVEGESRFHQARAFGRGVILVTAHLGPFEAAAAGLQTKQTRVHMLYRKDRFPSFERLRSEQRRRLGVVEVPVDDGLKSWFTLRDALRNNEIVLMQGDRTMPGQRGVPVEFLGGRIEIPDGPVRLAMITGSPLVPIFAVCTPQRRIRILVDEPIHVGDSHAGSVSAEEGLARLAASIAGVVARYPQQWLVFEKTWLEDRTDSHS